MTKLSHPRSGYNQLWRTMAYDSVETLHAIFVNPRTHTGKGYRSANACLRGCVKCGIQKQRSDYSKNQWRKNPGDSKCSNCIEQGNSGIHDYQETISTQSSSLSPKHSSHLPILFLGVSPQYLHSCGDIVKKEQIEVITEEQLLQDPTKAKITQVSQKFKGVVVTDDWFDVDSEYQPIANAIFQTLKDMYNGGGSVVIAVTMGVFSVPQQITSMFQLSTSWNLTAYTKRSITTTSVGKIILEDAFPTRHVYTKANFVRAPDEECLFMEYIDPEDYEDDSDYDEPPSANKDSPVVTHCGGPNGARISYIGFVNDLDVSWGDIILKLISQEERGKTSNNHINDQEDEVYYDCEECEINYDYIQCDANGCTKCGASIYCSSCKMAFYCSPSCKDRHKSAHIADCRLAATIYHSAALGLEHKPSEATLYGRAFAAQLAGRRDFNGKVLQAQYMQYEKNWEGAFELYKSIFEATIDRSPPEQREVYMGISRCLYEMGRYDHAIDIGNSAIKMNRHFQQVHKYVALSQKAKGDHVSAIATMTQAVIYESPWDEENIEANKAILKEIRLG